MEDLIPSRGTGDSRKLLPECLGRYCHIKKIYEELLSRCNNNGDKARLKAAGAAHAGDWLNATPIPSLGLRLLDEAIRVAVGHRLGSNTCHPIHACVAPKLTLEVCTALHARRVDRNTSYVNTFVAMVNDIIWRAIKKAQVPTSKEPVGCHAKTPNVKMVQR